MGKIPFCESDFHTYRHQRHSRSCLGRLGMGKTETRGFFMPSSFFLGGMVCAVVSAIWIDTRRENNPVFKQAREYQQAIRRYEELERKKEESYWNSMTGYQFEDELAALYSKLGYETKVTSGSGDGGVDVFMTIDQKTIVLQCKRHSRPLGPAPVRELFGVMNHEHADEAILACTGGFTKGARDFVSDKPIRLVELHEIIQMAKKIADDTN